MMPNLSAAISQVALGLDYATLASHNPRLIVVSVTPFGQDGPWATRAATEFTLQAETGAFSGRGYADLGPVASGCLQGLLEEPGLPRFDAGFQEGLFVSG